MSQEMQMPTNGPWGWYIDHDGVFVRRVSKLLEYGETKPGTFNLRAWQERQVVEGIALRDDLVLAVKSMGRPGPDGWTKAQKKQLDDLVNTAKAAAKERDGAVVGTALHTLTERVDRGEPIEAVVAGLPQPQGRLLRAYEAMRRLNGWRSVEIERTVWNEDLEVRGTFDRIDVVPGLATLLGPGDCQYGHGDHGPGGPTGELPVVVDVKTEKDPTLNGMHIAPQLATYASSRKMWRPTGGTRTVMVRGEEREVANGEYVPVPCVRQDVAIVVHLADGESVPLFVSLANGRAAAARFYEQMRDEQAAKRKMGAVGAWFAPVPNVVQPKPVELLVAESVAAGEGRPDRPGPGRAEVAVTGADGLVRWEADYHAVGDRMTVAGIEFTKHGEYPFERAATVSPPAAEQFIAGVWCATDLDGLSGVWQAATAAGLTWGGALAMAGDARRRQIECVQRALHAGAGVKCACGWMSGQLP